MRTVLVTAMLATTVVVAAPASPPSPADAAVAANKYVPVTPCRLADERLGTGFERVDSSTAHVDPSVCQLPDDAAAIVVSTTIVNASSRGWLVAYPSGTAAPTASTLNWDAETTRANTSTVALGADGRITIHRDGRFGDGAILVDVVGAFVPATSATSGRFEPAPIAQRLVDTRSNGAAALGPNTSVTLPLPAGVPADTVALAVNLTVVQTRAGGFFSLYTAGTERPTTSVLNADERGQSRAAATIVPVNGDGFELFTSAGAHVIVDMTGWFTGESAALATDGLFVPITPTRLRDTRLENDPVHPQGTIETALPPQAGGVAAAAISVTMINPGRPGYITTHAARTNRGSTSSGFGMRNEVTAQFAMTAVSASGFDLYAHEGSEITVDVLGWFTGTPAQRTRSSAANNKADVQRVIAIGDSTLAGIDRNRSWAQLRGAEFDLRARSCRRLVRASCTGREGPIPPPNALQELQSLAYGRYDVAVIMTGYNDGPSNIASGIPIILDAARSKGISQIIWMTHSREFRTDKGGSDPVKQVYAAHNAAIRQQASWNDDMVAMEWSAIGRQVPFWFDFDGIHLQKYGGHGVADFISRAVAHVSGQRCPMPQEPWGSVAGVCPNPSSMAPVDIARLYGV